VSRAHRRTRRLVVVHTLRTPEAQTGWDISNSPTSGINDDSITTAG
jgi:hypothetical protein